jgi:hypothetical protein
LLDTKERPSECSDCARYQKQIAKLTKAFINADDENVRRLMQYEAKISKFNAEKEWLQGENDSEKPKQKAGVS